MLKLSYLKHDCVFHRPGGTSRGVLKTKASWIIKISDLETGIAGYGEISILPGLNPENEEIVEGMLVWLDKNINQPSPYILQYLAQCPAISFGVESAFLDLKNGGQQIYYPSNFTAGLKEIPINGLVWMNDFETMKSELEEKVENGFKCIKIKVGAINIMQELKLIAFARSLGDDLIIRLDANGAFKPAEVLNILETFSEFNIHSIEQPIKAGQTKEMAKLARSTPIPIALDEELIGKFDELDRVECLRAIRPQYIILKPSLIGGISAAESWIKHAEHLGIDWWATSALESNIGLNIISQWVATKNSELEQGLGTGKLFTNNFESPLSLKGSLLSYNPSKKQELPL